MGEAERAHRHCEHRVLDPAARQAPEVAAERLRTRAPVLGRRAVLQQRWSDRPGSHEPRRQLNPTVAARSKWSRIEALRRNRTFRDAYVAARAAFIAGVREVLVDVTVKERGWIGVSMRAQGAALLRAGGKVVIDRPYELGDRHVARFARVLVEPGTLRLVARVGMTQDGESVEIDAWDSEGAPLPTRAPRPRDKAPIRLY